MAVAKKQCDVCERMLPDVPIYWALDDKCHDCQEGRTTAPEPEPEPKPAIQGVIERRPKGPKRSSKVGMTNTEKFEAWKKENPEGFVRYQALQRCRSRALSSLGKRHPEQYAEALARLEKTAPHLSNAARRARVLAELKSWHRAEYEERYVEELEEEGVAA